MKIYLYNMSKNIKKFEEFVNELNASTYANVMNKTEQYPWVKKGSGSFVNKDTKRGDLNRLAIEKFNDEFYSEFPESETKTLEPPDNNVTSRRKDKAQR